jgi:hypothetical protein
MPDQAKHPGEKTAFSRWREFLRRIDPFLYGHSQGRQLPEDTDLDYRLRLLAVYKSLKEAGTLVAPLPEWVTESLLTVDGLKENPRLQAVLAACTAYTPSKWLLEKELSRRDSSDPESMSPKSWSQYPDEDVYDAADREELAGLCFSGGGIRSATFCLGVMQAFAEARKLNKFDYLSTVSGGGYIHQWLASWIARDPERIRRVQERLVPLPDKGSGARSPEQILWLCRYSSYLTPRRGMLSADTWAMIAIWFRNTFLNQLVLFAFLACCLLLMRAVTYPFVSSLSENGHASGACGALLSVEAIYLLAFFLIVFLGFFSCGPMWRALASVTKDAQGNKYPCGALGNLAVVGWIVFPSCFLAALAALEAVGRIVLHPDLSCRPFLVCFLAYIFLMLLAVTFGGEVPHYFWNLSLMGTRGLFRRSFKRLFGRYFRKVFKRLFGALMIFSAIVCIAIAFAPFIYLAHLQDGAGSIREAAASVVTFFDHIVSKPPASVTLRQEVSATGDSVSRLAMQVTVGAAPTGTSDASASNRLIAVFLPVLFLAMQFLAIRLQLGMIGRFYTESRREWLGRLGGWSAIFACVWMVLSAIALYGPQALQWFCQDSTLKAVWSGLSVLAVHAVTLYAGGSSKSDGKPKQGALLGYSPLDLVGIVGAPICILSLLVIVSGLVGMALQWIAGLSHSLVYTLLFVAAVLLIFALFGWRVDVNEFSMHGFYRNRLARCYLGATDPDRIPDPFTHFDDREAGSHKNMIVSNLLPAKFGGTKRNGDAPYDGPFPIFCSTVNLTFGEELGWQDRKGASFAVTPLFTGYHVGWTAEKGSGADTSFNGFVPTKDYAYFGGGISMATAAAISGAALNPNMGYNSSPPLAFLMTLFNVRLGWWLANPRKPKVWPATENKPTPRFGPRYLLRELFGLVDDTSDYVCLSDGGHFENMGLYELVRRRCKHIVVCDAEQDTNTAFEGIGHAIAKCRTDFGAEIDLDLRPLIPDPITKLSAEHFRVGTIRYPAPPHASSEKEIGRKYEGTIVYLKSTVVGDETADLLHHKRTCPDFPQDSTLNQWFTESQFESYRRLGQLIGEKASDSIRFRA